MSYVQLPRLANLESLWWAAIVCGTAVTWFLQILLAITLNRDSWHVPSLGDAPSASLLLCPFIFFVLSYLVRIIILYLYSASILYYQHLPLTGHLYLPEITEISILSSLTAKYLSVRFHLLYSDRLSHGSLPSCPLTPLDSPPYCNTYASLSYDPIRLIFVAVDASPYCAPSGAFCRSWRVSLV